ncbi:hypothetical protein WJX84_006233 [Apatococcus fuscideae]|uniref:Uncharacterized protein n=1 Tax=Apatococcus fuscideae TaxID=2026836 RepID=A0AAW1SYP2_9CHLO
MSSAPKGLQSLMEDAQLIWMAWRPHFDEVTLAWWSGEVTSAVLEVHAATTRGGLICSRRFSLLPGARTPYSWSLTKHEMAVWCSMRAGTNVCEVMPMKDGALPELSTHTLQAGSQEAAPGLRETSGRVTFRWSVCGQLLLRKAGGSEEWQGLGHVENGGKAPYLLGSGHRSGCEDKQQEPMRLHIAGFNAVTRQTVQSDEGAMVPELRQHLVILNQRPHGSGVGLIREAPAGHQHPSFTAAGISHIPYDSLHISECPNGPDLVVCSGHRAELLHVAAVRDQPIRVAEAVLNRAIKVPAWHAICAAPGTFPLRTVAVLGPGTGCQACTVAWHPVVARLYAIADTRGRVHVVDGGSHVKLQSWTPAPQRLRGWRLHEIVSRLMSGLLPGLGFQQRKGPAATLQWSHDGRKLAVGGQYGDITVLNVYC